MTSLAVLLLFFNVWRRILSIKLRNRTLKMGQGNRGNFRPLCSCLIHDIVLQCQSHSQRSAWWWGSMSTARFHRLSKSANTWTSTNTWTFYCYKTNTALCFMSSKSANTWTFYCYNTDTALCFMSSKSANTWTFYCYNTNTALCFKLSRSNKVLTFDCYNTNTALCFMSSRSNKVLTFYCYNMNTALCFHSTATTRIQHCVSNKTVQQGVNILLLQCKYITEFQIMSFQQGVHISLLPHEYSTVFQIK